MIDKCINANLKLLQKFRTNNSGILTTGNSKNHSFNGLSATIEFGRNIELKPDAFLSKDLNDNKDIRFRKGTEVKLSCSLLDYYISGSDLLPSSIKFPNFNNPEVDANSLKKQIIANIHNLSNQSKTHYKKNRFYRFLLPVEKGLSFQGDFYPYEFAKVDAATNNALTINIEIENENYHFFSTHIKKQHYIVIDSLNKVMLERFTQVVNSIFMTYAFLKGTYYGGLAHIFSYNDVELRRPIGIRVFESSETISKGYEIHTTNPYKYMKFRSPKFIKNKKGMIERIGKDTAKNYMFEFPMENYSKLCELILLRGSILRSFILIIDCSNSPLELKIPAFFVALENITKVVVNKGENNSGEIFEEKEINKQIKQISKEAAKKIKVLEQETRPKGLSSIELKERKANYERLITKLHQINKGSNNQKLAEPFEKFGYILSKDEENALYIHRNKFIHGDDFFIPDLGFDKEFKELFHLSFLVYTLCAILLLKLSGFSGYIVNLPKAYAYITKQKTSGRGLIKI
ncbi:hypothetical protein [Aequorivita antarctica]|uniref:ApeA N-terminal domain-containing protein n=1 Tax=Aequorivita antarctica TaxID=153266 RepID=A0A5C6YZD6_9FLAO|nr:hypothetical protein [Aequorivita antarctica]TXD72787.1 hypothetical protein ESU54_11250 [Aequorivita antarctica]